MSETATQPKKKNSQTGKKVSEEVLLKRRLGRIKAAETMALKIKRSGIEKSENNLQNSFHQVNLINQKNYYTDYLKKDEQVMFLRKRRELFGKKSGKIKDKKKGATPMELDDLDDAGDGNVDDDEELDDATAADTEEDAEKRARKLQTLAIHPGSKNIRIGYVQEAFPKTFPNVIAVPNWDKYDPEIEPQPRKQTEDDGDENLYMFGEEFAESKKIVQKDFKERMRYYKRRVLPNSNEAVRNFNKKVQPEIISDLNDPHKQEWIASEDPKLKNVKYLVGNDALKLADNKKFKLRYPVVNGEFNENSAHYRSRSELLGDVELIISTLLSKEFSITSKNRKEHNIVLVIPDMYDKATVESYVQMFLQMEFNAVSVIQESMAVTFGAGISQACIIDIGAEKTTVSCIDEGMIINDSRVKLDYGGDDITNVFAKLLVQSDFPYNDFNLKQAYDFKLLNDLKEKYTTFQDADIAVQLYDFLQRKPKQETRKYQFKVFDEVMLSPMGLFYPDIFQVDKQDSDCSKCEYKKCHRKLFPKCTDVVTGKYNNPTSSAQKRLFNPSTMYTNLSDEEIVKKLILMGQDELNANNLNLRRNDLARSEEQQIQACKLDLAIIESITNACKNDMSNCKKFYENLLLVGGVAKTPSIDVILADRLNLWRPRILSNEKIDDILKLIGDEFEKVRKPIIQEQEKIPEQERMAAEELEEKLETMLDGIISERLPKIMQSSEFSEVTPIQILSPPKDIDPQCLTWKGAAVFARLKIINELWITGNDWDILGSRALHYKVLFSY